MTLLYALGAGVAVNVVIAVVFRLLRQFGVRTDVSGDAIIVAVAATIVVASLGMAARRDLALIAILGLASPAPLIVNRMLGVAATGRAPLDPVSTDAFLFAPRALAMLAAALVLGAATGAIVRAYGASIPWQAPEPLLRAAGMAFVASAIASVMWPAPFFALFLGEGDLATTLVSLPLVLAGPIAGGIYAIRQRVVYRDIGLLALFLALPSIVTLLIGTAVDVGRLGDRRFDSAAGQIRATIILAWLLVALRIAGWPLGALFAQAFLPGPPAPSRDVTPSSR